MDTRSTGPNKSIAIKSFAGANHNKPSSKAAVVSRGKSPIRLRPKFSLKVSLNCRGLLTSTSGHILSQDRTLISTPETPIHHPTNKPTSLHVLLSLSSSLPLLSENSILGRSFRTHAFLSSHGEADTLRGLSLGVFDHTLGAGLVGKLWEVS